MSIRNKVMIITYPDSLGKNLKEFQNIRSKYLSVVAEGIHILPFYPSSADRGFAPTSYEIVDPAFGAWEDVEGLSRDSYLMFDFMINHISRSSEYFKDFLKNKDRSPYADFFIRYKKFWPTGKPSEQDVELIYKRKPRDPSVEVVFADGSKEDVWCTFDEEQIDLNLDAPSTRAFVRDMLLFLAERGASIIRLDAFAYATKKIGTNCFFVEPEVWELLEFSKSVLAEKNVEILPEIHEHYSIQQKLAEKGYWVYDFALPMLLLHSIYFENAERLASWLRVCPRKQFTTLDTHDGIGVVDVRGLLSDEQIEQTKNRLFDRGANVKRVYNTSEYNNLDIYQINCTYYSALGDDDEAYLLARAVQFFAPGIPQVYYVGLLAGGNDLELLESTKVGRNINRHYYDEEEVAVAVQRPVVKRLFSLIRFRNSYPVFDGEFRVELSNENRSLKLSWTKDQLWAELAADFSQGRFTIRYRDERDGGIIVLD